MNPQPLRDALVRDALVRDALVRDALVRDALAGFRRAPKTLPCKWFYDARGSQLFEAICELPEYYPTRTETAILHENLAAIAARLGEDITLIEFGSGSSSKTRLLLEHCDVRAYVPLDISVSMLETSVERLRCDFPNTQILPLEADYSGSIEAALKGVPTRNRVLFFPGSTLGNFESDEARGFLEKIGALGTRLLIGADLQKPLEMLLPAYNDAQGVTAQFNINVLARLNREAGADFEEEKWRHEAIWDERNSRIEMRLVSMEDQTVRVANQKFRFERGEWIVTELSHKYSAQSLAELAREAFWCCEKSWSDARDWFCVQLWRAC